MTLYCIRESQSNRVYGEVATLTDPMKFGHLYHHLFHAQRELENAARWFNAHPDFVYIEEVNMKTIRVHGCAKPAEIGGQW